MSEMHDEYHEYRVDTQRWTRWPKALIMTHKWSTNGHDRRLEQRRYVPDDYATRLEMENFRIKAYAEHRKKLADEELDEAHDIRHNITRLRDRVHEVAADRDRIKDENAKLLELVREYAEVSNHLCTQLGGCSQGYAYCKYGTMDGQCKLGKLNDMAREIGIEVTEE